MATMSTSRVREQMIINISELLKKPQETLVKLWNKLRSKGLRWCERYQARHESMLHP
jgi:hypothetical protein